MKYFKLITIITVVTIFISCSEDFLERYPLDELSPDDYFKTAEQLEIYANRFYILLPAHVDYYITFWAEKNSDNLVPGTYDPRLSGTRSLPSSAAQGGWTWDEIRQANYFLAHCHIAKGTPEDIQHYIGEVKFFRAFLYFDKLKTFGDVPWINKPLNTASEDLYAPRVNRRIIADSIIADLDFAISHLKSVDKALPFRINKEVAMIFKARVCLYEGTWEKYHSGTEFGVDGSDGSALIQLAAETADLLMQSNKYSLYQGPAGLEYGSLFNQADYTGYREVMLWKKFDIGLEIANNVSRSMAGGAGDLGMSKGLIDSYLCTDGHPISVSPLFLGYDSLEMEVTNRDPRLIQSIYMKGYDMIVNAPGALDQEYSLPPIDGAGDSRNTTGYAIYKGHNPEYSQQANNLNGTTGSIIFRYAEVLLIYAEAKAELQTITQEDLDRSVNLLRERVGMPDLVLNGIVTDPSWDYPLLSPIINEVRRERRIELMLEMQRWDDLARWRAHHLITGKRPLGIKYIGSNLEGAYTDFLGNPNIFVGVNLFVDENGFIDPYQNMLPNGYGFDPGRDYLSPIPSDEITLNNNLTQNPGW